MSGDTKLGKIVIALTVIIIFAFMVGIVYVLIRYGQSQSSQVREGYLGIEEGRSTEQVEEEQDISQDTITDNAKETLNRAYGKVEIVWVNTENKVITDALAPKIKDMTPVKYDRNSYSFVETNYNDADWYNYEGRNWANAVDENGSYFVWIPRFAYKIVYYEDNTYTKVIGYSDARGILKLKSENNYTRIYKNNTGVQEVGNHYILAPAFSKDTSTGFKNGGWDEDISGIWVSKYEMSMEMNGVPNNPTGEAVGDVTISDTVKAVSKPGVSSWRNISIGNCYYNAFYYNRDRESHLIKNSEWGAVTYLAYSKYGRDGYKIDINRTQNYISGGSQTESEIYNYLGEQSTTGNATGVYDMVGSAWEYVASFINNGYAKSEEYAKKGEGYLFETLTNSKYKTIYNTSTSDDGKGIYNRQYAESNYAANTGYRGDAMFETSTNAYGSGAWNSNSSFYMQQDTPFLIRGGDIKNNNEGTFSFHGSNGGADPSEGYRVALVCE